MAASTISVHQGSYDQEPYTYYPVVIIGAGSSGIAAGCRIKSGLGFDQFAVFERQGGPGGVWWVNRYPGIACDIPSFFYSLSFMPHTEATELYAKGADIVRYYWRVCNSYKITDRMQFDTDVKELRWLEDEQLWEITIGRLLPGKGDLSQKEREALIAEHGQSAVYTRLEKAKAKVVISAVGGIVEPRDWKGKIAGLDNFKGPVMHSARWNYDVDFNGKDVVVVGAGSTASQVVPALIEREQNARSVTQIMRSPPWVAPKRPMPGGAEGFAKWSPTILPWVATLCRYIVFHQMETEFDMMFKTGNPAAVAKNRAVAQQRYLGYMKRVVPAKYHEILTPRYTLMCKRRVFDATWFKSLNDDRVSLELGEIADMGENSVTVGLYDQNRASDNTSFHHNKALREGAEEAAVTGNKAAAAPGRNSVVAKKQVPCDVLVLANGYEMGTWIHPIKVYGKGGNSIHDVWESRGGPQMYLGTAIDGFPNFFMIFGPNTASGHSSVIVGAESSVEHALKFIRKIFVTKEVDTFEVKEKPCRDYVSELHRLLKQTAFSESGLTGCGSSYIKDGWNSTVYPRSQTDFAMRCRFPNMRHWNAQYTAKGRFWNILRQTIFSGGISAVAFWFYLMRYGGETWRTGFNTAFKTVFDRVRLAIA